MSDESVPVREEDAFDVEAVAAWLRKHAEAFRADFDGTPDVTQFPGGASNLTYQLRYPTRDVILRRPPAGVKAKGAHDMGREYLIQDELRPLFPYVATMVGHCTDESVIGSDFYVMEKVDGVILRTPEQLATLSSEDARRCSDELVDVLAAIHAVDYEAVGLSEFGRPDGYVERQVRRWGEQWQRSKTRELPAIDELARRLHAAVPVSPPPTIVHGDYRLDNTMLAPRDLGRIVAVLDWEMATLGDPLADLGLFLVYWAREDDGVQGVGAAIDAAAGFATRAEVVDRYAKQSGRDVSQLDFYEILASYKLAIILEGIHARYLMGKTVGAGFEHIGNLVEALVTRALDQASGSPVAALRG